jgi:hypothetical protein
MVQLPPTALAPLMAATIRRVAIENGQEEETSMLNFEPSVLKALRSLFCFPLLQLDDPMVQLPPTALAPLMAATNCHDPQSRHRERSGRQTQHAYFCVSKPPSLKALNPLFAFHFCSWTTQWFSLPHRSCPPHGSHDCHDPQGGYRERPGRRNQHAQLCSFGRQDGRCRTLHK